MKILIAAALFSLSAAWADAQTSDRFTCTAFVPPIDTAKISAAAEAEIAALNARLEAARDNFERDQILRGIREIQQDLMNAGKIVLDAFYEQCMPDGA